MKNNPLVSICVPTYNSEHLVAKMINSVLRQKYSNFEIIISDDCSKDRTIEVIKNIASPKIRIYRNQRNLGYGDNLKKFKKLINGEIIYLLAQDDLIINEGLEKTVKAFTNNSLVGAVTRPYYWFGDDPKVPIRTIPAISNKDLLIDINKEPRQIIPIIESVGQLSGLAYRSDLFSQFHSDVFPAHIYPFMEIIKSNLCCYLASFTVAIGTYDSQTRSKSSIYDSSPTESWMKMFDIVFSGNNHRAVRNIAKDHMAKNYLGLIQLKNFSRSPLILYKEIVILVKYRVANLFSAKFWFFVFGTILVPRAFLIILVDNYKKLFGRILFKLRQK